MTNRVFDFVSFCWNCFCYFRYVFRLFTSLTYAFLIAYLFLKYTKNFCYKRQTNGRTHQRTETVNTMRPVSHVCLHFECHAPIYISPPNQWHSGLNFTKVRPPWLTFAWHELRFRFKPIRVAWQLRMLLIVSYCLALMSNISC